MTPIERYIHAQPAAYQSALTTIYHTIKSDLPLAEEQLKYQMPTFYWHENVIHFALFKHHIGLYPTPSAISALQAELTAYHTSKGAIQLPLDQPVPVALIHQLAQFRQREIDANYYS
ncbi:iron chaperone [Lactiplantibacillus daowaiensis]|uniref:Iron chaperone n=1 Tax=Lactiplantibacillus daowaiensis TaxID=2559918 RepID=A0ABW1S3Y7_9LACO|nr:DUF1801 domain-containing protein [Lactiplantibacillus daowaiensis]